MQLVFLFVLLVILLLIIIFMTAKIEIKIINLVINTQSNNHINDKYEIILKLNILEKLPIIKFKITKKKLSKMQKRFQMNEKIKKLEKDILNNKDKIDFKFIDMVKELRKSMYIKKLNLEMQFGTENAFLTAMLVAIFSSILSIGISNMYVRKNSIKYQVKPIYIDQNFIKIVISGIFQIKLIHIINIIYVFNKKGGKKDERTSDRRSYDYSYE